jgi:hypothetical protein
MKAISEVSVMLSNELLAHLRGLAADLDIPLEWLVAGLVCDTIEGPAASGTGHRRVHSRSIDSTK